MRIAMAMLFLGWIGCDSPGGGSVDAAVDAAIDASLPDRPGIVLPDGNSCSRCGVGQVCVQRWDGVCVGGLVECITTTATTCDGICGGPPGFYSCIEMRPCGNELPDSFKCYGP